MGAEVGATTSTFPYSENMRAYLRSTRRGPVAAAAGAAAARGFLSADEGAEYDNVIEIVSFILHLLFCALIDNRTSQNWSPLSTAPSLPTWPLRFPSLVLLSRSKAGRTNSLLVSLGHAPTALMRTWYAFLLHLQLVLRFLDERCRPCPTS